MHSDHEPQSEIRSGAARYPLILLIVFLVWTAVLGVSPHYRQDWLLENLLVLIAIPLLVWNFRKLRFSNFAYTAMFVFFCLHEVGAHYTYSEVPYARWFTQLTGSDLQALLNVERNHFDRAIHFSYGLLLIPAIADLLDARARLQGIWRHILPVMFVMSNSEVYELIEWQAAEIFGGELGQAYLGTQGDIWDAQKDTAMALTGAIIGLAIYRLVKRRKSRAL
jgi:putative membrane protein